MVGLIIFRADWCPHCRLMEKAGVEAALQKARPDLSIVTEDLTDGETEMSKSLHVRTIPAFVLLDEEGEIVKRASGSKTVSDLERWLGKVQG
jgi:thiol-disulfide isomerase/thioredoxin